MWLDRSSEKRFNSFMKKASITEAKNKLSALIDAVKGGTPVLIVDRGRPVARLEPVVAGRDHADEGRLSRLVREGLVRPARNPPARALIRRAPPRPRRGASVVAALLAERREDR
jgi:prevent-host-death family protein